MFTHLPVLLNEVMQFLNLRPDGRYIDATFGAGGHTRELLDRTSPGGRVLAVDQDETAIEQGRIELQSYGSRLELVKANFRDIESIALEHGFAGLDGILADIGVSSMMLDDPTRGFSFMREGPLDMRMDLDQPLTAADVLNTYGEKEIANILFNYGEERRSRQIAGSIVRSRPLSRTTDLTRAVERVLGGRRYGKIHPATRTFQALRIFVNQELDELQLALIAAERVLKPGGRLVVVSFHSLEDRIVKNFMTERAGRGGGSRHQPEIAQVSPSFVILTRRPVTPDEAEIAANPRARSAKLRAAERTAAPAHAAPALPDWPTLDDVMRGG
jgi:16S rRNA (cytosine1402-N4)-methyltransferase